MNSHQEYSSISYTNLMIKSNEASTTSPKLPSQIASVLFPCIVFTGVICNTLTLVIMRRRRMSHLSTSFYMRIIAIADTSVLLLGLWIMLHHGEHEKQSLLLQSIYSCNILSIVFYIVSDTSVWLVCMMSVDRCIAVTRPLHASSICTVRRAKITVCILLSCTSLINTHFLFTYDSSNKHCRPYKRYEFFIDRIWPWIDAAVYSVLPFILLLTINLIIVHSLFQIRHSTSNLQICQSHGNRNQRKLSTSMSRKLTTMLLAATFFFLLTSFPIVLLEIYTTMYAQLDNVYVQYYFKPLCETLQYLYHSVSCPTV
jgi:hypothetical protein